MSAGSGRVNERVFLPMRIISLLFCISAITLFCRQRTTLAMHRASRLSAMRARMMLIILSDFCIWVQRYKIKVKSEE